MGSILKGGIEMEVVLAFIMIVLVGVWAVWVIKANQHKPRKNEKFMVISINTIVMENPIKLRFGM